MTSLPAVCSAYVGERILAADYQKNLTRVARNCQHLTASCINDYLRLRLTQVSVRTVANERAMLLILWRYAYDNQLVDQYPRGIAKLKVPTKPVRAWTISQCCTAVKQAIQKRGQRTRTGADSGRFLECWLRLGYATGARWSDLWQMTDEHLDGNVLRYTQNKTGSEVTAILPDECVASVKAMLADSPDGRILGWVCRKRRAMRIMKAHLKGCGLAGTSKWLRRSSATHVEIDEPGAAQKFLGHKTRNMVRHYLDVGQIRKNIPRAPALVE